MRTVHATAQQVPSGPDDTSKLATRELSATSEDYDEAKAELEQQVPPGWRLISFLPDYDAVSARLRSR